MDSRLDSDAFIENALTSQPLAPMPRDITADVMARIQINKRPAFVTWNDAVIVVVISLTVVALFITFQSLPPIALVKLRIQGLLFYQWFIVNARWLVPTLFFGLAATLVAFAIPPLFKMTVDKRQ